MHYFPGRVQRPTESCQVEKCTGGGWIRTGDLQVRTPGPNAFDHLICERMSILHRRNSFRLFICHIASHMSSFIKVPANFLQKSSILYLTSPFVIHADLRPDIVIGSSTDHKRSHLQTKHPVYKLIQLHLTKS